LNAGGCGLETVPSRIYFQVRLAYLRTLSYDRILVSPPNGAYGAAAAPRLPKNFLALAGKGFRLDDSQQPQDDKYDHNYDQYVDHIAGAWDAGEVSRSKEAEQPQREQYYDNPGKHDVFPY
jgi:hypothetical protein